MSAEEILKEIEPLGTESYKRVMIRHGVREPFFGVKIGDLQKIVKRIKWDYRLALDLYASGNYDAMYLAGLIADDARMTKADLRRWLKGAYCQGLSGVTVPWVAAGSAHGWELGLEWIESDEPLAAVAGWATLASWVSIKADAELDLEALKGLLMRVKARIDGAPNLVRYQMNGFVISLGCYVKPLTELALQVATEMGPVAVDMGDTACQVPYAPDAIRKVEARGSLGKKRKTVKC